MAYSEKVMDHYENPRNVGKFDPKKDNIGTGMVGAPACGDVMRLQIEVSEDGIIQEAKFKTFGCGSAIASSSLATAFFCTCPLCTVEFLSSFLLRKLQKANICLRIGAYFFDKRFPFYGCMKVN